VRRFLPRTLAGVVGLAAAGVIVGGVAAAVVVDATADLDDDTPVVRTLARPLLDLGRFPGSRENLVGRVGLARRLGDDVRDPTIQRGCIAVGVPGGGAVFTYNGAAPLIPASTAKLFTAAAALKVLGPEHRFTTQVLTDGSGRVFLRGGGDPTLASPEWIAANPDRLATPVAALANVLNAKGVRPTAIVADASFFDMAPAVEGWEARYSRDGTAPQISALAVDRSRTQFPPTVARPAGAAEKPHVGAAAVFVRMLGAPETPVSEGTTPAGADLVAEIQSPPVSAIIAEMNKHSDNFVAEVLTRDISQVAGTGGTTSGGVRAVRDSLAAAGVDLSGVSLHDGSGLHRASVVPCQSFLSLLRTMHADKTADVFFASLAVGGSDGTLRKRPLPPQVKAKTGTLNDVSALVGVVETAAGPVDFAVLQNGVLVGAAQDMQDEVAADLLPWPAA
jgi:D-alanyl-D-alanine carboxypeptidase/D-alanyl-D-alanine-endopeptidase (penicillin-binding protein 4)